MREALTADKIVRHRAAVPRSHLSWPDLVSEAAVALTARPARTVLTALGTILGVTALVATLGLAKTAGSQIVSRFDELEATQIVVRPPRNQSRNPNAQQVNGIPWDAGDRLQRLNGVVAAGTKSSVAVGEALSRSVPIIDPQGQSEFQIPVISVSPGLFDAVRAVLATGRVFDDGHNLRGDNVAVLGPGAASRLNVGRVDNSPAFFLGENTLAVIGILDDVSREPELLNAIIVPDGYARDRFALSAPDEVIIEVAIGAAELIGSQAAIALSPNDPDQVQVSLPPSPRRVRSAVEDDVNALFLVLGGVSLLVGAIGIANVTLVSVLERTSEIGLRRALGATRHHIAVQFLFESAVLGAFAGLIGTSLGIITIVAVSANREWTPILDAWLPFAAPFLGALIGLVAGTYPAWKASATEPIAALRNG
jgi:ABC-type antimicrobial peptide transport system permease subunit